MSQNIPNMLDKAAEKLREMVSTNTVVGEPIVTGDVTIIPISAVSIGYVGGGSDFVSKNVNHHENPFGGGVGGAVKVSPVAFLVVKDGSVRVLPVAAPANTTADRLVEMIPDTLDKIVNFIDDYRDRKAE